MPFITYYNEPRLQYRSGNVNNVNIKFPQVNNVAELHSDSTTFYPPT